jgi:hypothetical protein
LIDDAHRLKVRVLKKDGYWVGLSEDLAGGSTGDTLPELFAEIEFFKRSGAGFPVDAPICVEYVAPGVAATPTADCGALGPRQQPARRSRSCGPVYQP